MRTLALAVLATAAAGTRTRTRDISTEAEPVDLPTTEPVELPTHHASHKPMGSVKPSYSAPKALDLGFGDEDYYPSTSTSSSTGDNTSS